jgi:hypothetical protein
MTQTLLRSMEAGWVLVAGNGDRPPMHKTPVGEPSTETKNGNQQIRQRGTKELKVSAGIAATATLVKT